MSRPAVFLFRRDPGEGYVTESFNEGVVLLDEIAAIVPWTRGSVICLKGSATKIFSDEPTAELIKRWLGALVERHPEPYLLPAPEAE